MYKMKFLYKRIIVQIHKYSPRNSLKITSEKILFFSNRSKILTLTFSTRNFSRKNLQRFNFHLLATSFTNKHIFEKSILCCRNLCCHYNPTLLIILTPSISQYSIFIPSVICPANSSGIGNSKFSKLSESITLTPS